AWANMWPTPKAETEVTTHRIEWFSDGVFAIAITLLILEIKVPHFEGGNSRDLAFALLGLWPSDFGYVFSFVMIGIHWISITTSSSSTRAATTISPCSTGCIS